MKYAVLVSVSLLSLLAFAQPDSVRKIEPGKETSFDNFELLVIALLGLLLLIGLRFWFRRTRKH
jgi:hypothetical protein